MVIHRNNLPFNVIFNVGNNGGVESSSVDFFTDSEEEDIDTNVSIKEYSYVEVILKAPKDSTARLYVDGFDMLMKARGNDEVPTIGANQPFKMYAIQDGDTYFPLVPGRCQIAVYMDGRVYYSYINVEPKRLQQDDLDKLRAEIEAISNGLAKEVATTNVHTILAKDKNIVPLNLDRYSALKSSFNQLRYYLTDIASNPLTTVKKEYQLLSEHKIHNMDAKSSSWLLSEQGQKHRLRSGNRTMLCPVPVLDHNILPNQWVKHMINDFIQMLHNTNTELSETIPYYRETIRKMRFYNEVETKIKRYQYTLDKLIEIQANSIFYINYFKSLLQNKTFSTISELRKREIPMILTRERRYNYVYRLYRSLITEANLQKDAKIVLKWKTTDRLYEYWCFIKLIEVLKEMGYTPLDDLVKISYVLGTINIIDDETRIQMKKNDNEYLIVHFNAKIPKARSDAIKEGIGVWSRTKHNKPDMRIDIYKSGTYTHSIVIDAKYKDPRGVWDKKKASSYDRPSVMEQLNDYKIGIIRVDRDELAVKQVFVFCPENIKDNSLYDEDKDYNITMATLRPSSDTTDLKRLLESYM